MPSEEQHVHDPSQFSFIPSTKLKDIHSGAYSYNGKKLQFRRQRSTDKESGVTIYKTNTDVYQTAEYVDMFCSGLIVFSTYKVARNSYIMATQAGTMMSYAPFTFLWFGAAFF